MKKKIFVVISMLILVFAMTACGSSTGSGSGGDSTGGADAEALMVSEDSFACTVAKDGKSMTITANKAEDGASTEISDTALVVGEGEGVVCSGSLKGGSVLITFIDNEDPEALEHLEVTSGDACGTILTPGTYSVYVSAIDAPTGSLKVEVKNSFDVKNMIAQ